MAGNPKSRKQENDCSVNNASSTYLMHLHYVDINLTFPDYIRSPNIFLRNLSSLYQIQRKLVLLSRSKCEDSYRKIDESRTDKETGVRVVGRGEEPNMQRKWEGSRIFFKENVTPLRYACFSRGYSTQSKSPI